MIIDSHSHLQVSEFDIDREACFDRCYEKNVNKLVMVGFSRETNEQALKLKELKPEMIYNTAGLHPDEASPDYLLKIKTLENFLSRNKVYAIGECGLDYHYTKDNKNEQLDLFEKQILLSIHYNLPLVIHSRDASQDTFDLLNKYKGKIFGVMHCYSGSAEMAKEFIKIGFYIGIGGVITFKNAKSLKNVCKEIPLSKILIETDCPYMTPVPHRGKRNESSYVKYVLDEVVKIKEVPLEEAEKVIYESTCNLFGIEEKI